MKLQARVFMLLLAAPLSFFFFSFGDVISATLGCVMFVFSAWLISSFFPKGN